jgi:hypothetical protein
MFGRGSYTTRATTRRPSMTSSWLSMRHMNLSLACWHGWLLAAGGWRRTAGGWRLTCPGKAYPRGCYLRTTLRPPMRYIHPSLTCWPLAARRSPLAARRSLHAARCTLLAASRWLLAACCLLLAAACCLLAAGCWRLAAGGWHVRESLIYYTSNHGDVIEDILVAAHAAHKPLSDMLAAGCWRLTSAVRS